MNINANATTNWVRNVYLVGSIPALGGWNTANAVALSSQNYPYWTAALSLPTNTCLEYKYIKIDRSGNVTGESGNRLLHDWLIGVDHVQRHPAFVTSRS